MNSLSSSQSRSGARSVVKRRAFTRTPEPNSLNTAGSPLIKVVLPLPDGPRTRIILLPPSALSEVELAANGVNRDVAGCAGLVDMVGDMLAMSLF